MTLTVGSLFSGIGGFDLGLERAGMRVAWQCEKDEAARRVLARHWPDVTCYPDVRTLPDDVARVDVLAGGFPCQDASDAGRRAGIEGEQTGLWAHFAAVVRRLRPRFVLVENVTGLLARGWGTVVGDLAASGYDAEWDCIPAAAVGAPHLRAREFLLAYPCGFRGEAGGNDPIFAGRLFPELCAWWATEPALGRVADGLPPGLGDEQLRLLGNAVVPMVAELVGTRLLAAVEAAA